MSKFKVGDKIVLKKNIDGIDRVGIGNGVINNLKDKICTVKGIDVYDGMGRDIIRLKDSCFLWNAEIFELAKAKDDSKGNFKVKCIKGFSGLTTKDKVYEVVNSKLIFDDGNKTFYSYENVDELNKGLFSKFELVKSNPTIIIHTKGNETIATLKQGKEVVKTAKAKCNPSDEFNFEIGAKLAFERLMGREKRLELKITIDGEEIAKAVSNAVTKITTTPFDWEAFKQGKIAIHCDTEEKAKAFLQQCEEQGIKWCSGAIATEHTFFSSYKERVVYCCFNQNGIEFSDVEFYKSENIDIYEYQLPYKEVQRKAKVGEFVKVVNTSAVPVTNGKPEYKDGDVLEIISNDYHARYAEGVADDGKDRVLLSKEYVVLEGYEPKKPPVKEESTVKEVERHGKVGEYIKLTQDVHEHKVGSILKVEKLAKRLSGKDCGVYVTLSHGTTSSCICNSKYVVLENYQPTEPKQDNTDNTIKVGDTVKVVESDNTYSLYSDWFNKYEPRLASRFAKGRTPKNGNEYKVIAIHEHGSSVHDTVYAIEEFSTGDIFIMSEKGIKKVTNP